MANTNVKKLSTDKYGQPIVEFYDDDKLKAELAKASGASGPKRPTPEKTNMQPTSEFEQRDPNFVGPPKPKVSMTEGIKPSFMDNILAKQNRAGLSRLFATGAKLVSGNVPDPGADMLIEMAGGRQLQQLREGEKLGGLGGFGLTNKERSSVIGEQMAERKMGQEERQLQLAENRLAQEAGLGQQKVDLQSRGLDIEQDKVTQAGETAAERFRIMEIPLETPEQRRAREESVARIRTLATATSSASSQERLWFNSTVDRIRKSPEMSKFGKLIIDPLSGETILQMDDPVGARKEFERQLRIELTKSVSAGKISQEFMDAYVSEAKPDFEL